MSAVERLVAQVRRPGALVVLYAGLAAVAVTTSAPGRYVGENRLDQYVAPGHRLVRSLSLWDPTRGLGRTREDLWPLQLGPLALLRSLGLSPVAAQRTWHAILLVVAAAGAVAVLRAIRGAEGGDRAVGPFIAGVVYGFGPYALTFLTPANLFAAYAIAPWVVLCALRGPASERPWRSAAVAALLIGSLGNADYPGVVLSLLAVPLAAAWSARRAGLGLRRAAGWLARAAGLTLAISAAALWKTAAASAVFAQRVSSTESPQTVGVASSWSETWRGLGFWLSYFRSDVAARPQTAAYFTDPPLVLVTFLPALLALLALALPEVRGRVLLGLAMVGSAVVMVGIYPVADAVPFGRILTEVLEASATTAGFRTTYKAGAGFVLGVAVLGALAVEALMDRAPRGSQVRPVVAAIAVVGVVVAGLPAWTGDLYDATRTSGPIPGYWTEAARDINARSGGGRVLVLPASTRTIYDWGWVGDDILDSLLTRPHAVDTAVPLSGPEAADILAAVSQAAGDARHRPGAVAAVLRRLGIDMVLVRNDIDAEATRTIGAEDMRRLRFDPGLQLVATYGATQAEGASSATSTGPESDQSEIGLELYEVIDPGPSGPHVVPDDDQLVVSGSGDALVALGADGDLETAGPTRFSGAMEPAEAVAALGDGGRLVLSDSNRRRVTVVNGLVRNESWTLAADQDLDREAGALFDRPGSQSVAWFRDATAITASGAARGGRGSQPATRPAAAFDDDPSTWWQTVGTGGQVGTTLRVDLREPTAIGRVRIDPLGGPRTSRRLTAVDLRFSDGTSQRMELGDGSTEVQVDAGESTWVEIRIAAVSDGSARPVGIREVVLDDLDLREWIAMPDDLIRAAGRNEPLADALAEAPFTAVMAPDQPEFAFAVEPVLRRRVRLPHDADLTVTATVRPLDQPTVGLLETVRDECGAESLDIDGQTVPLTLADPEAEVAVGQVVALRSCDPVAVEAGWREVETSLGSVIDTVRLDSGPGPVAGGVPAIEDRRPPAGAAVVDTQGPDRIEVTVDAPDGGVLLSGQSFDERWEATIDGVPVGAAALYDGQSGWEVPAGIDQEVVLRFRPAQRFRVATWISLAGVVVAVALAAGGRRRQSPPEGAPDEPVGGDTGARAASSA